MDPTFGPPWSHEADGQRLRHDLRSATDPLTRAYARVRHPAWEYVDAQLRGDPDSATAARHAFRTAVAQAEEVGHLGPISMAHSHFALAAVRAHDLDGLAEEIMAWYPTISTTELDEDVERRTTARTFVDVCTRFLLHSRSPDHPRRDEVTAVMWTTAGRVRTVLTPMHDDAFRALRQLHGGGAEAARLRKVGRSAGAVAGGLVPALPRPEGRRRWLAPGVDRSTRRWLRQAQEVIDQARTGRSTEQLTGTLRELVAVLTAERLVEPLFTRVTTAVADAAFVLAEAHNDAAALDDLADRLSGIDHPRPEPLPSLAHLVRAYARLAADVNGDLDRAMTELACAARSDDRLAPSLAPDVRAMLSWLRACRDSDDLQDAVRECELARELLAGRPGAADIVLARLLLWRALLPTARPDDQVADLERAHQLAGRHCRSGADRWRAVPIRDNARNALDAVSGTEDATGQARRWQDAARESTASSTADQARVALAWVTWAVGTNQPDLAADAYQHLVGIVRRDAALRHRPEARDLVLAQAQEHTEEAAYWLTRAGRHRDAVVALETGRAVALSTATGGDPTELLDAGPDPTVAEVTYDDITAATADGVLIYLAAAKSGGFALIVAGTLDPRYVQLADLDRVSAERLRAMCLPAAEDPSTRLGLRGTERDLRPPSGAAPSRSTLGEGLRELWNTGIGDLVLKQGGSRIVTIIPIGQLSLLPLHAASDLGALDDERTAWRHAGNFSAIRYAPNARVLRRCRATAAALADAQPTMLAADVPDGAGPGARLHHVRQETTAVAQLWSGQARVEHDCTWGRFRALAVDHAVWRLACHAVAYPYAAERSTLSFADVEVTIEELRGEFQRAPRRLVVLSACQTNLTGVPLPNEVVGFPSTMLKLGFAGVIATAWPVDDRATACLMIRFHHLWRVEGQHPAVALNRAQRWLRHATREDLAATIPGITLPSTPDEHPFADPDYWAAFAYTGA